MVSYMLRDTRRYRRPHARRILFSLRNRRYRIGLTPETRDSTSGQSGVSKPRRFLACRFGAMILPVDDFAQRFEAGHQRHGWSASLEFVFRPVAGEVMDHGVNHVLFERLLPGWLNQLVCWSCQVTGVLEQVLKRWGWSSRKGIVPWSAGRLTADQCRTTPCKLLHGQGYLTPLAFAA